MTDHSPDHAERAADIESAIRIALWNACKSRGMRQDGSIQLVAMTLADPALAAALRGRDAVVEQYRHVKRGTVYTVVGEAELQTATGALVDGSALVVYRGDDGKLWAREEGEFHDGRFTRAPTGDNDGEGK